MDSDFDAVQTKRHTVNQLITEVSSIVIHANLSYANLTAVIRLHKESGCPKDCFDSLPALKDFVQLVVDLNAILQELGNQVATAPHSTYEGCFHMRILLGRAHSKIEEAEQLFAETLTSIKKFTAQPKKCLSKRSIYRYFNN